MDSDFTLKSPRNEFISSKLPSASAIADDFEIRWSQPNVFVVPVSPFRVYSILMIQEQALPV